MLETKNVCKFYNGMAAVRPTSLNIGCGQVVCLVGPSGCGKSTLMRIMLGLIAPSRGTVWFKGQKLTPHTSNRMRLKMGYVIQQDALFPHLTSQQNATIVAKELGWSSQKITKQLDSLMELTHFPADRLHYYPTQLSGGQRQKVGLIRALMLQPDILFLDEPFAAVDPLNRSRLQLQLRDLIHQLGKTVVLVTHDLAEAEFFSDTIVLMKQGEIVQTGCIHQLLESPSQPFVADFMQSHVLQGQVFAFGKSL